MADYFTNFSFIVPLNNAEQQAYALDLHHQLSALQQGEEVSPDFPESLKEFAEDCFFEIEASEPHAVWLQSMSGGIDAVCAFVQHLLQKFNPQGVVSFEWSHDCSKPLTNAYGGGAAIIKGTEIKTMNTADWLRSMEV